LKKYIIRFLFIILPSFASAQQSKTDSLLHIVNQHAHDSSEVRALYWLGFEATKKEPQKALLYYWEAIRVSETFAPGTWGGVAYLRMASLQGNLGQNDSAKYYLDKADSVLKQYPNDAKLRNDFYSTAGLFNKGIGRYEQALKFYDLIAAGGESDIGKEGMAGNYLNIANIYRALGNSSGSQEYLFKALSLFEETKNETGISFCYNGIGNEFYKQKKYSKAEEYLLKSLALKEKADNKRAIVTGLNGLAVLYMDLEEYPKALLHINRAIEIAEELRLKDRLCETFINKGMIRFKQGDQREAEYYFLQAKTLAEELKSQNYLAYVNVELGRLYQQRSANKEALASLLQAVEQARQVNSHDAEEAAHHLLADLYYSNGQYQKAYDEYLLYHALYDTSGSAIVKSKLYDMEAKYETKQKETEIALLKKDQQLKSIALQQQNTFQTAILVTLALVVIIGIILFTWYRSMSKTKRQLEIERMRNHIAQDLHDDIGSTLSSINIISKMGSLNPMNENATSNFAQIEDHSGKMLSQMADIIWSINPGNDTLHEVMLHMKEFAAEILEPKNIEYYFSLIGNAENQKIDAGIRKNLFLIFKEALNNAMKYSHCTVIKIELALVASRLTLDIIDNGDGFSMEEVKMGNGLNNMKQRALLMNGQFQINPTKGRGTQLSLSVRIA
jgi:two-component system, NarL family, sensor histidine kinase UhpB